MTVVSEMATSPSLAIFSASGDQVENYDLFGMPLFTLLAYHEAAHAVTWFLLAGVELDEVRISPTPKTLPFPNSPLPKRTYAAFLLAGLIGEILLRTRVQGACDGVSGAAGADNSDLERFDSLSFEPSERRQVFESTMELIAQHWSAVDVVAMALLSRGRLSGAELQMIVRQAA